MIRDVLSADSRHADAIVPRSNRTDFSGASDY